MTTEVFEDKEFALYRKLAGLAHRWELPHDKLDNGIVLHNIPIDTSKASTVVSSARFYAKQSGYQIRATWLDNWTVKIVWYK